MFLLLLAARCCHCKRLFVVIVFFVAITIIFVVFVLEDKEIVSGRTDRPTAWSTNYPNNRGFPWHAKMERKEKPLKISHQKPVEHDAI